MNDKNNGLEIVKMSENSDVPLGIIPNFDLWSKLNAGNICESKSYPYGLYIPLSVPSNNGHVRLIGLLVLGPHIAKREYRSDELQLIRVIADQAGAAIANAQTFQEHEKNIQKQISLYHNVVLSLAQAIEARDPYTRGHSEMIAGLSIEIGKRIGLTEKGYYVLRWASLLHDVGKIGIRDSILYKPSKLTDDEWKEMRRHPDIGAEIVGAIPDMKRVSEIIRCHHENYDGSGYPNGLSEVRIPVEARIIRITDSFLAMTDYRPYNKIMTQEEAIDEIKRCAGKQYDPSIAKTFIEMYSKASDIFLHGPNSLPLHLVSINDNAVQ
jgi:HD-GYP domain-containing protein (c-di-GMP phosphodiesterase class II)